MPQWWIGFRKFHARCMDGQQTIPHLSVHAALTFHSIERPVVFKFSRHFWDKDKPNIHDLDNYKVKRTFPGLTSISGGEWTNWVMVYWKATHTDQYLNFGSNHHLQHKWSMVETLTNRANKIINNEEDKKVGIRHVRSSLRTNGDQEWMFRTKTKKRGSKMNTTSTKTRTPSIGLPYIRGLSKKLTPIFKQHGIGTFHKHFNTRLCTLYTDNTKNHQKCRVVYRISCLDCGETYIAKTERTLGCMMIEHTSQREPTTAVGEHIL